MAFVPTDALLLAMSKSLTQASGGAAGPLNGCQVQPIIGAFTPGHGLTWADLTYSVDSGLAAQNVVWHAANTEPAGATQVVGGSNEFQLNSSANSCQIYGWALQSPPGSGGVCTLYGTEQLSSPKPLANTTQAGFYVANVEHNPDSNYGSGVTFV